MSVTPSDYNDDAIKGEQLATLMTDVAADLNTKQAVLDVEVDVANKRLKFNNVAFTVTPAE
ncbi:MAG: hypothetical protein J6R21_07880 [Bacteroidales bacterium]|jgi:hypothetical protein|nr:hypothetical protein [Bacteroidales bacterium]